MATDTEALREQFEAWARKNELEAERHKYADDQYDDHAATSAWWAWRDAFQAGHAAAKAETAAAVAQERERASVLYDMLLNRPALSAGLESEYAAWTSKCYQVTGAYKAAIRAGVKEPSDA